jgi:uncharacterized membrane protein YeaQ/YmgE (transglycosylase-associated protein family)
MGWIVAIIVGAFIGWVASIIMNTNSSMGAVANILVGIVGAALGRWIFGTVLGIGGALSAGDVSFSGIFWGIVGSLVLIGVLRAFNVMRSDTPQG